MDRVHARAERRERVPCQMKTQHSKELAKIEQSILVNTRSPYIVQMFFSFQSKRTGPARSRRCSSFAKLPLRSATAGS